MFTLKIQNSRGETFELTHNTKNYALISVQGLTRPPTAVNTSTGGALDGSFYNSSRVGQRNLVLTVVLRGDIEANRQHLYRIFPEKSACTVYFKNKNRDVKITGYVETLDGDLFSMRETMQISIICPRPFWESMQTIYTELSAVVREFQFPFSIEETAPVPISERTEYPTCTVCNDGDVPCGCTITIDVKFIGTQANIVNDLRIYNLTAQEFFGFSNFNFVSGDRITISTISGQLSAVLDRGGTKTDLLHHVAPGSSWFRLPLGENVFTFTYNGATDLLEIVFQTALLFGGV